MHNYYRISLHVYTADTEHINTSYNAWQNEYNHTHTHIVQCKNECIIPTHTSSSTNHAPSTSTRMTEINKATVYTAALCKPLFSCSYVLFPHTKWYIEHIHSTTKGPSLETSTCKHTGNRPRVRGATMSTPCTPYKLPLCCTSIWDIHSVWCVCIAT